MAKEGDYKNEKEIKKERGGGKAEIPYYIIHGGREREGRGGKEIIQKLNRQKTC